MRGKCWFDNATYSNGSWMTRFLQFWCIRVFVSAFHGTILLEEEKDQLGLNRVYPIILLLGSLVWHACLTAICTVMSKSQIPKALRPLYYYFALICLQNSRHRDHDGKTKTLREKEKRKGFCMEVTAHASSSKLLVHIIIDGPSSSMATL